LKGKVKQRRPYKASFFTKKPEKELFKINSKFRADLRLKSFAYVVTSHSALRKTAGSQGRNPHLKENETGRIHKFR